MISIKKIEESDTPLITSWKDNEEFCKRYSKQDLQNITSNLDINYNRDFLIINDDNQILGIISLKNIDFNKLQAEYSIYVNNCEEKNVINLATNRILMFAFQELGLEKVYLYVEADKTKENSFYNQYGFNFDCHCNKKIKLSGKYKDINWYSITRDGFFSVFKSQENDMTNVKRRYFTEITDNRGNLIALENPKQLEFPLNRIYYMYNIGEGIVRGKHSHYDLEQMLICVSGCVTIITRTPYEYEEYILNSPNEGLYIGPMIWREMLHFSNDSVLLVLASNKYDADDYIRDYDLYQKEAKKYFRKRVR